MNGYILLSNVSAGTIISFLLFLANRETKRIPKPVFLVLIILTVVIATKLENIFRA